VGWGVSAPFATTPLFDSDMYKTKINNIHHRLAFNVYKNKQMNIVS